MEKVRAYLIIHTLNQSWFRKGDHLYISLGNCQFNECCIRVVRVRAFATNSCGYLLSEKVGLKVVAAMKCVKFIGNRILNCVR